MTQSDSFPKGVAGRRDPRLRVAAGPRCWSMSNVTEVAADAASIRVDEAIKEAVAYLEFQDVAMDSQRSLQLMTAHRSLRLNADSSTPASSSVRISIWKTSVDKYAGNVADL
jgi:hypothetical protein